jgi:2'-5' RNA ligase
MSFQKLQKELFDRIEIQAKNGNSNNTLVAMRGFKNDTSRCLTAVFFLSQTIVASKILKLIDELRDADSRQYYYPVSSLHLTIQNVRTESIPPLFNKDDIEKAKSAFSKVISKHKSIKCYLKGLFELPTSLSVRGYTDKSLKDLVLDLRQELISAGVPDNKKYASEEIFFCNSTICRYQIKPNDKFFEIVRRNKNRDFGIVDINKVDLMTTNAVADRKHTGIISSIPLNSS